MAERRYLYRLMLAGRDAGVKRQDSRQRHGSRKSQTFCVFVVRSSFYAAPRMPLARNGFSAAIANTAVKRVCGLSPHKEHASPRFPPRRAAATQAWPPKIEHGDPLRDVQAAIVARRVARPKLVSVSVDGNSEKISPQPKNTTPDSSTNSSGSPRVASQADIATASSAKARNAMVFSRPIRSGHAAEERSRQTVGEPIDGQGQRQRRCAPHDQLLPRRTRWRSWPSVR